jgi:hypothetical protein
LIGIMGISTNVVENLGLIKYTTSCDPNPPTVKPTDEKTDGTTDKTTDPIEPKKSNLIFKAAVISATSIILIVAVILILKCVKKAKNNNKV